MAANHISNSRRSGTTANHQSAWKKWVSWRSERQNDPVTYSINFVLNFLGNLFENKCEYSTINSYRSAISAYYNLVEGKPVGQHISVCNLMTGVFNKNRPRPKYTFIWDVEKVLKYIKTLPTNTELSERTLKVLKLTSLLFLISSGRSHEICYMDISYMVKTASSYKFHFSKLTKNWKKGKAHPEPRAYPQDSDSCVMT